MFLRATTGQYDDDARRKVAGKLCAVPDCSSRIALPCQCCHLALCREHGGAQTCTRCAGEWESARHELVHAAGFTSSLDAELRNLPLSKWRARRRAELDHIRAKAFADAKRRFDAQPCTWATDDGVDVTSLGSGTSGGTVVAAWPVVGESVA